jgi:mono/diheme cytochrome c family protein
MTSSSIVARGLVISILFGGCVGEARDGRSPPTETAPPPSGSSTTPPAAGAAPVPEPGRPAAADPAPGPGAPPSAVADSPRGLLGCPTVDAPAYGAAAAAVLSQPFQASCATCHGGAGQGTDKYPRIPGTLTEAEFVAKVRSGVREMPAFPADFVSDADLTADYAKLRQLALQPGALTAVGEPPSRWSAAKIDEIYRKGLAVWRKPGAVDRQACSNCHSPDGIELAVIAFSDDSILRRAQQHVSPEDALVLRDFVHAQRRRFDIARPCSTDWRPFQPGGTVLPGATRDEQDAAFLAELKKRSLILVTGKVVTLDDAKKAFAELQAVKLRELPLGIPLPRWSEDKFNGAQHRDINDYMPIVPTVPNRPTEYYALEDAYLAGPTDAGLYRLLDENRLNSNDLGYTAMNTVPSDPRSNCGAYPTSTSWLMGRINRPKRLNVLVSTHLFREELRKPGSFARRPAAPFPDSPVPLSPAFTLGAFAIEPPCYDGLTYPLWFKSFPAGFRDELPEKDLMRVMIEDTTNRITHVWMTLGQVMDPTLISTDDMTNNKIHYWAFRNFTQKEVHLPFLYVHRIASQAAYWTDLRTSALFPKKTGPFNDAGREGLHPLLSTVNQESAGLQSAVAPDSKTLPAGDVNRFKGNLIRMMMLLSRDLLQKGAWLQDDQNFDHCLAVTCQTQAMNGYVSSLKTYAASSTGKTAFGAQGFDLPLYQDDTGRLIAEVLDLMAKAPRRKN